ncbi:MAG: glycine cleavage system protein H [Myxococcaceae bacterium]
MSQFAESFWVAVSVVGGLLARFGVLLAVAVLAAGAVALLVTTVDSFRALRLRALGVRKVGTLWWHPDLLFSGAHTWVRRAGRGTVRFGVDDLAQRICVGAQEVTLPAPGTRLEAGEPAVTIRSGGRTVTIASPLAGTVVGSNGAVARNPGVMRREPYHRGWLVKLVPDRLPAGEFRRGEASRQWLRAEETRLNHFLERELSVAAADGGEFLLPAASLLSDAQWTALTRAFLAAP